MDRGWLWHPKRLSGTTNIVRHRCHCLLRRHILAHCQRFPPPRWRACESEKKVWAASESPAANERKTAQSGTTGDLAEVSSLGIQMFNPRQMSALRNLCDTLTQMRTPCPMYLTKAPEPPCTQPRPRAQNLHERTRARATRRPTQQATTLTDWSEQQTNKFVNFVYVVNNVVIRLS